MTSDGDLGQGDDDRNAVDADGAGAESSDAPRLIPDRQWGQRPGRAPAGEPGPETDDDSRPASGAPRAEPPPPRRGAPGPTRFDNPAVVQPTPQSASGPPRPPSATSPSQSGPTPTGGPPASSAAFRSPATPARPPVGPPPAPASASPSGSPADAPAAPDPATRPSFARPEPVSPEPHLAVPPPAVPGGPSDSAPASSPDSPEGVANRRAQERTVATLGELAQQLAATQAQVTSLSAQLTTLAHRLTYDLERGAQTTSERILRDLGSLPEQVSQQVGMHLGPAIDDLTDQVEADRERLVSVVAGDLAAHMATIAEAVDALPLGNVELINSIETLGADLQDRLTRFSTRMADQVQAIETSTAAELARLRTHLDEVRESIAQGSDHEVLDRMAGQVERLAQRPAASHEIIDAVETLIDEHLDVIRDNLDARVSALAPALHDELETVRAEALAGITATEEHLAAQVDALEATITERVDTALGDQIDALDALVSDRHEQLLSSLLKVTEERLDELSAAGASSDRADEVLAAIAELQTGDDDPLAAINEELQALRRRIKVRFEAGDAMALSPDQLAELARQVAAHLR